MAETSPGGFAHTKALGKKRVGRQRCPRVRSCMMAIKILTVEIYDVRPGTPQRDFDSRPFPPATTANVSVPRQIPPCGQGENRHHEDAGRGYVTLRSGRRSVPCPLQHSLSFDASRVVDVRCSLLLSSIEAPPKPAFIRRQKA